VRGSGPAGRILHEDLDAYLAQGSERRHRAAPLRRAHDEEQMPVIGLRRKIAQRMQDATRAPRTSATSKKSTSPPWKPCARTSTKSTARAAAS
jgi:pyruvate/2-oxoglutarate dehydrogenase complex dihydrolipoamide acyltransferase (E2) component